jgi:hypothetical protein
MFWPVTNDDSGEARKNGAAAGRVLRWEEAG